MKRLLVRKRNTYATFDAGENGFSREGKIATDFLKCLKLYCRDHQGLAIFLFVLSDLRSLALALLC